MFHVEHLKFSYLNPIIGMMFKYFYAILIVFPLISGCNQPNGHPESLDPAYDSLQKEKEKLSKEIQAVQKDIDKAKTDFETAPIRTGQREDLQEVYFELQHQMELLTEKHLYLGQKIIARTKSDRASYLEAYNAGGKWPNPDDYKEYMADKSLQEAPKEWDVDREIRNRFPASIKTEKKAEH